MKIKALSRSSDVYLPSRSTEGARLPKNLNPELHPFQKAREYTRALNATKLERVFAQPFVGQLGVGHQDGVYVLARNPKQLNRMLSGSGDGIIKYWDMSTQEQVFETKAHDGLVNGLTVTTDGRLLSCSNDKTAKLWDINNPNEPVSTYLGNYSFNGMDHHRSEMTFATASTGIDIWNVNRDKPTTSMNWGVETVHSVRFNQTETSILASTGSDRSIVLYDLRTSSPVQRLVTALKTNSIAWNPMEAFNFAAGSEDHNIYTYDMRKMSRATNVLKDHVGAVMDVDYSPTGQELVSGSYDRTIRIYRANEGHSRDVYHTKRMQRVFAVRFSMDSQFIVSGSDDGNVRLWRSNASSRLGVKSVRQRTKLEYDAALKEKYKHMPEIRRVARHRHVPKSIKKSGEIKKIELDSIKRKQDNIRRHSKKGTVPFEKEREKHIVKVANEDQ